MDKASARKKSRKGKDDRAPLGSKLEKEAELEVMEMLKTEPAGYLETEGDEKSWRITQEQIVAQVPLQSAKKRFDLKLNEGEGYQVNYTRDGKHLLVAGRRGHVAAFEWERGQLRCEMTLNETVRAAKWLNNDAFFALAQKNFVYIYDKVGTEVHRLQKHTEVEFLEYLPYHFLLCSNGAKGVLRYQDITHGQIVAEYQTSSGRCHAMRQNPSNGVLHLGHAGGLVTLWSPAVNGPLVTMQCHSSPIQAIAIDSLGHHMATSGLDGHLRIWDLRTWKKLHEYTPLRPATSLDISQRGLLSAVGGPHLTIWRDGLDQKAPHPYLYHLQSGTTINNAAFCPFDDVMALGHVGGVSSILVPGAGEPNYDSYEVNPYYGRNQRREAEVKQLLDKLPPETIMLDQNCIGEVARTEEERHLIKEEIEFAAQNPKGAIRKKKQRTHPRKSQLEREARRRNIIEEKTKKAESCDPSSASNEPKTILDRFKYKG